MPQAFKHFLDTLQQEGPAASDPTQGDARAKRIAILALLERSGPVNVDRLRTESGLEFTEFAYAMKAFIDAGLIELSGPPGAEIAQLTTGGSAVAAL